MTKASDTSREGNDSHSSCAVVSLPDVNAWFVREVLPLEAALMQYLNRGWPDKNEVEDLCHDVYVRVYEAARTKIPEPTKPFVFTVARNLLIDRARRSQIVPIDTVAELETLDIATDQPGPDRSVIARDELRRLRAAVDRLPRRCREAVTLRKIEGLSIGEIAVRMGISIKTVDNHLREGADFLADILHNEATDRGRNT